MGIHDSRVKEHLIHDTSRSDSWVKPRDEILEIEQHPREKVRIRPHHCHRQPKRDNRPRQRPRVLQRCFYWKKKGHMKSDCRERQKDLAQAGGQTADAATTAALGHATNNTATPQLGALSRANPPRRVSSSLHRCTASSPEVTKTARSKTTTCKLSVSPLRRGKQLRQQLANVQLSS